MNIIDLYKLNIECEDIKKYQNNQYVHHLTCGNQHDLKPVLIRNDDAAEVCLVCDLCKYIKPYSGAVKEMVSLVKDNNMKPYVSVIPNLLPPTGYPYSHNQYFSDASIYNIIIPDIISNRGSR